MKGRTFGCSVCDFESYELVSDEEAELVTGTECPCEGCSGKVIIIPGGCHLSSTPRTNIKTSGWFRERSQDMKRKFPNSRIGTGIASI